MHGSGEASEVAEMAYRDFAAVATTSDLNVAEVPEHYPLQRHQPITLSLRGVVGFSDVIRRIIITLDAELARSKEAEQEFLERWRAKHPTARISLKSNEAARSGQINNLIRVVGLPEPLDVAAVVSFLQVHDLTSP